MSNELFSLFFCLRMGGCRVAGVGMGEEGIEAWARERRRDGHAWGADHPWTVAARAQRTLRSNRGAVGTGRCVATRRRTLALRTFSMNISVAKVVNEGWGCLRFRRTPWGHTIRLWE